MKQLIYAADINDFGKMFPCGMLTWNHYCRRHGLELIHDKTKHDVSGYGAWHPWFSHRLRLDSEWDRLLLIDVDTIVRWDAPNIFDIVNEDSWGVTRDVCDSGQAYDYYEQWSAFRTIADVPIATYFNSGFICLTRKQYTQIVNHITPYYWYWKHHRDHISHYEQTPINLLANKMFRSDMQWLDSSWNNIISTGVDLEANVWHFAGLPVDDSKMSRARHLEHMYKKIEHHYA